MLVLTSGIQFSMERAPELSTSRKSIANWISGASIHPLMPWYTCLSIYSAFHFRRKKFETYVAQHNGIEIVRRSWQSGKQTRLSESMITWSRHQTQNETNKWLEKSEMTSTTFRCATSAKTKYIHVWNTIYFRTYTISSSLLRFIFCFSRIRFWRFSTVGASDSCDDEIYVQRIHAFLKTHVCHPKTR